MMSMIDTGTESLLKVTIFMTLADALHAGFGMGVPLSDINTLSEGENTVTMRRKEKSKPGRGCFIILGVM